jgi:hypothetical protein
METQNEMTAFCGIRCNECQAYKATQAKDTETLVEVAKKWSSDELQLVPEDVLCDGCQSERVFNWAHNCTTRTCGLEKGVENCALCGEYICEKLEKHWGMLGEETRAACKANLDNYRN